MAADPAHLCELLGAFARPEARLEAAAAVAQALGADRLLIFSPDPELGMLLPVPGLAQTLPDMAAWRAFLAGCRQPGECAGTVGGAPVRGFATAEGVVVVVTGPGAPAADLSLLSSTLPVLGALFRAERETATVELRLRDADQRVARAGVVSEALQQMRLRLEGALREAEAARREASEKARQAEDLAEELQAQATQLQDHAAELEMLNEELEASREDAETARAIAEAANRAKSEFLANMSHELRTPINAVLGYGELLEMELEGPLTKGQRAHLGRIRSSSRHLLTLISDILDLAKVEAGQLTVERTPEQLREVVWEAMSLVQAQYEEKGVSLERRSPAGDTPYCGDRDRVRQILLNLLSNAFKFTDGGGAVSVSFELTRQPDPEAELPTEGEWAVVRVEDDGAGIAEDSWGAVFEPFVQVEGGHTRTVGGTGLGLTISRHLARLMGGDLTLRSELGKGSCFSLWLPAH